MIPDDSGLEQPINEEKEKKVENKEEGAMEIGTASGDVLLHYCAQDHAYSKLMYKFCVKDSIIEFLNQIDSVPSKSDQGVFLKQEVTTIGSYGYYCLDKQYDILDNLGRGGYGVVKKVKDKRSRKLIARKQITREKFRRIEVEILLRSDCVSIPKLYGVSTENQIISIWMEFVAHNLGCTSENVVKLLDFGSARRFTDISDTGFGITPEYLPPECFHSTNLSEKSDIWSGALSVLYLITGKHPWSISDAASDRFQKVKWMLQQATASSVLRDHSINDVYQHQWLHRVLFYMLQTDPCKRCSASVAQTFIEAEGNRHTLDQDPLWINYSQKVCEEENFAAAKAEAQPVVASQQQLLQLVANYQQVEHQIATQNGINLNNQVLFIAAQQQQQQPRGLYIPQQLPAVQLLVDPVLIRQQVQAQIDQLAIQQNHPAHINPGSNCVAPIPDWNALCPNED